MLWFESMQAIHQISLSVSVLKFTVVQMFATLFFCSFNTKKELATMADMRNVNNWYTRVINQFNCYLD